MYKMNACIQKIDSKLKTYNTFEKKTAFFFLIYP
jgi:hypothetical protein